MTKNCEITETLATKYVDLLNTNGKVEIAKVGSTDATFDLMDNVLAKVKSLGRQVIVKTNNFSIVLI